MCWKGPARRPCPDLLEVRGLGILNIRRMFGDSAIKRNKRVRLIIHLVKQEEMTPSAESRLQGLRDTRVILGVGIPAITLPIAPGRYWWCAGGMRSARSHPAAGRLLRRAGYGGASGKSHGEGYHMRIIVVSGLSVESAKRSPYKPWRIWIITAWEIIICRSN